jgi:hypothetical protein
MGGLFTLLRERGLLLSPFPGCEKDNCQKPELKTGFLPERQSLLIGIGSELDRGLAELSLHVCERFALFVVEKLCGVGSVKWEGEQRSTNPLPGIGTPMSV